MHPAHRPRDDASTAYKNKTLVHNWWEDRYVPGDQKLSTTDRIFANDLGAAPTAPDVIATTKRATDLAVQVTPPPAAIKKPSMYSAATLEARLATYGNPVELTYTHPSEGPEGPEYRFETTANHFFAQLPEEARATKKDYFATAATGKAHNKTKLLMNDIYDGTRAPDGASLGGKGLRGEVTRNPREAGNPYGVSVFVDDYAKWQTKLAGMPLDESVKKAQTKYF